MKKYYIMSVSGGKDSTAMFLKWLEKHGENPIKYPLDEVLYLDTGMEFPQMYTHINKLKEIACANNIPFTILASTHTFNYYLDIYSWPWLKARWCTNELKIKTKQNYYKNIKNNYEIIEIIGYAYDEITRAFKYEPKNKVFPLISWKMTEKDCLEYCYKHGFYWEGLYDIFSRVSCWCCPLQSLSDLRKIRKYFPELWLELLAMDRNTFKSYKIDYSVDALEIRFRCEERLNTTSYNKKLKKEFLSELNLLGISKTGKLK